MIDLIIPPSHFLTDQKVFPTLGVLRLGAVLRIAGYDVRVTDFAEIGVDVPIGEWFGVTATTPQMPDVKRIVERIRKLNHNARICLGGAHATMVYASKSVRAKKAQSVLEDMFDCIVVGDGEKAILKALEPEAPKVIYGELIHDQDSLPWPDRDLIDIHSYHYTIDGHKATSIQSQLGCPFGCGFCGGRNSSAFRNIRSRGIDSVCQEIKHLYLKYGFTGFMFFDDEMNVSKRFVDLLRALKKLQDEMDVRFAFRGFVKAELFTDEQAIAMKDAGFKWVLSGFESGSDIILSTMNKTARVKDNDRCVEIARRHGLKVKACMSIGHPGESEETIKKTREWILRTYPDEFDVTIITPYPGSPYYDEAVMCDHLMTYVYSNKGEKLFMDDVNHLEEMDFYKSNPGEYKSHVWTEYIGSKRLVQIRDEMEKEIKERLYLKK